MAARKSDLERGYYGVWLLRGREGKGWTQRKVVEWLAEQGLSNGDEQSYGYYRQVEAGPGKRFGTDIHEALVKLYGNEPLPLPQPEPDDLASAIREQARAIERLAKALERDRDEAPAWAQAAVDAVLAGRRLLPTDIGRDERGVSGAPLLDRVG